MAFILNPKNINKFGKVLSQRRNVGLTQFVSRSIQHFDVPENFQMPEEVEADESDFVLPGYKKMMEKPYGLPNEFFVPKIETTLDLYAKKLREVQIRERYLPADIQLLKQLRKREPTDLMEELKTKKEFVVQVNKRDQWNKDLHLVAPWSFARFIKRTDNGLVKPYDIDIGATDPVRVIFHKYISHPAQDYPMKMTFNRFIVGRPNPIRLEVHPVNIASCPDRAAGANLEVVLSFIDLWTYTDVYPTKLELDCSNLSVSESLKLGDLEKMLPEGVYLHNKYLHRLHNSILKLEETKLFKARRMNTQKKEEEFQAKKREIELADAMGRKKGPPAKKKTPVKKK